MKCLVGVDAMLCGCGISLHVAHQVLSNRVRSRSSVSDLLVVKDALVSHSLCPKAIGRALRFRY